MNIKKLLMASFMLLLAAAAAYLMIPSFKNFIDSIFAAFVSGDFTVMRNFVAEYGVWSAAVSFCLIITLANANLFGWIKGAACHGQVR